MPKPPLITLLTDFGLADYYVAAMKGVILGICPDACLVDISHEIRAFGIEEAAIVLGQAYCCFPQGTIHVVVVDPGVGSARRPLLVEAAGHFFIGPDNGALTVPMDRDHRFKAREINAVRYFGRPVSNTFHGRDVFAPIAAHLAGGVSPSKMGRRISDPMRLDFGGPVQEANGCWTGRVLYIDRFGNLVTNFRVADATEIASRGFEMLVGSTTVVRYSEAYASVPAGQAFVISGSSGYLEVSVNKGDASQMTRAEAGSSVTLIFS
jgi:S-adenosylmethionine hydrolase